MLTLFYAPGACSFAPHIVLEEIGVPFEAMRIATASGEQHSADYRAINPRGRVPALRVADRILTECPAILHYVAKAHPGAGMLPADTFGEAEALSWLSFLASSVHIAFAGVFRPARYAEDASVHPQLQETGKATVLRLFADIEERLPPVDAVPGFVFGNYTVVDPYLAVFHRWAIRLGLDLTPFPRYRAHYARVVGRPAVKRAAEREGIQFYA